MLEYLEQLIKEQKWEEALVIAEQLLLDRENSVEDQLRINLALITARAVIGEYSGVVLLGDHAARMAADLEDWDAYLTIHHYLGYSLYVLNQWTDAKRAWMNYCECMAKHRRDNPFEVITWFHLGLASQRDNDIESAIQYFLEARRIAKANDNQRQVAGINHALITAYTQQGEYQTVPKLLASTARYLRNNPNADDWSKARLHHLQVRASFALTTKRYKRAKLVALRALSMANAAYPQQFTIHMTLAEVAKNIGTPHEMVDHYLRARVSAIRARRYDFEVDAADSLYTFVQSNPNLLDIPTLDEFTSRDIPSVWFEMEDVPSRKGRM